MSTQDWDATPANNTTVPDGGSGINVAEGCAPGNINDAIRQMMATVKGDLVGADQGIMTGTAGSDGDLAQFNGDGDLVANATPLPERLGYAVSAQDTSATLTTSIAAKLVTVDATAGDVTHGLPAAADMDELPMVAFYRPDSSGNAVSLDGNGSETILGQAVYSLAPGQLLFLWSDGSNYHGIERLPGRIDSGEITSSLSQRVFALPASFREIKFSWYNADLETSGEVLQLQLGTGTVGSPTWRTTYVDVYVEGSNSAVTSAPQSLSSCPISPGILDTYPSSGETLISGLNETQCLIRTQAGGVASGPAQRVLMRHHRADAGGPFTVMRVFASSGNIDGLHWTLDGIA